MLTISAYNLIRVQEQESRWYRGGRQIISFDYPLMHILKLIELLTTNVVRNRRWLSFSLVPSKRTVAPCYIILNG